MYLWPYTFSLTDNKTVEEKYYSKGKHQIDPLVLILEEFNNSKFTYHRKLTLVETNILWTEGKFASQ